VRPRSAHPLSCYRPQGQLVLPLLANAMADWCRFNGVGTVFIDELGAKLVRSSDHAGYWVDS